MAYGSGLPFTISAQDLSDTGGNHEAVANQICNGKLDNPTQTQWFNTSCYTQPGQGLFGNARRNSLIQGTKKNWDFALFKNIPVTEMLRFQLRGEFYNVFNQHYFENPDLTVGDAKFGSMQTASSPRTAQIGLKMLF